MSGRYWIVDETSCNILGTLPTRGQAVDYVAALLSVNDDDFLEELTISNDAGPLLYGDSLHNAPRQREAARKHVASSTRGNSSKHSPAAAMTAKSYRS